MEDIELNFIQTHSVGGDCTAPYNVEISREISVKEFVEYILTKCKGEWGYIDIENEQIRCEYRYGKLLNEMPNYVLNKRISSIKSVGGWSRMDYYIKIIMEEKTKLDEVLIELKTDGIKGKNC